MTLIGATTENPYFEVNSALISRTQIYELYALEAGDLEVLLRRAIEPASARASRSPTRSSSSSPAAPGGDARAALNALQLACATARRRSDARVSLEDAEDAMQRKALLYDKAGDQHYDFISAWIKSTRGSDPDASLYYLVAMLEGGEDPRFIARRMIVLASEDVGNADPQALELAVAAAHAVEHVGMPECQFALAQAAIYLSLAPKSDAVERALGAAHGAHRRARRRAAAGAAAVGRLPGGARARPRPGLRLPARPPGPRQRPGAPARGTRGPAPLRARRRRGGAARAAGAHPPRAPARAVTALYDTIGRTYASTRGEDPRLRARIHAALGTRARC